MRIDRIAIADIGVKDRLRPIDDDHAKAIAMSIADIGLINPITVRRTPASSAGKYTLVAGGHRLRACEICGHESIEAIVVSAGTGDAQVVEIAENFYRNDLSKLDRAIFVGRLRELWEEKNGPINPKGGRPKNSAKVAQLFEGRFSDYVAERLGVSRRTAQVLDAIARNLHPALREAFRRSAIADNQSALRKCTKLEPAKQQQLATAYSFEGDLAKAFKYVEPAKGRKDRKQGNLNRFLGAWALMSYDDRREALDAIGAMLKPIDSRTTAAVQPDYRN